MSRFSQHVMECAIEKALETSQSGIGGPFGAAVVKDGEVICVVSNTVIRDNDPTAHAEVNAIRTACKKLGSANLSGCELYATGEPCPMCLSAIIWANIKKVYYCNPVKEAEKLGFRDEHIYNFIENSCADSDILEIVQVPSVRGRDLYEQYAKKKGKLY